MFSTGEGSLHPSIRMVLSYLLCLRHLDRKHSTILSHIPALSSCTNKVDGVLLECHPLVARWVLGDRAKNPPRRSLVPRCNLLVVLAALIEKPFEPLHQTTTRDLTLKVFFLLAATSSRRVSENHALCIDPPLPFLFRTHCLFVWHRTLRSCLRCPQRWPFPRTSRSPPFTQSIPTLWSRVST